MKELSEMELKEVDGGGSIFSKLSWIGAFVYFEEHYTEIKKGICDGWTECHSS